jgi:hypothetical protein
MRAARRWYLEQTRGSRKTATPGLICAVASGQKPKHDQRAKGSRPLEPADRHQSVRPFRTASVPEGVEKVRPFRSPPDERGTPEACQGSSRGGAAFQATPPVNKTVNLVKREESSGFLYEDELRITLTLSSESPRDTRN